jgi:purine-binding chemotaxis protein CheW
MTSTQIAATQDNAVASAETKQFVTMVVDGQMFGIPVQSVQDILRAQRITNIPLAPKEILGSINLRGRIVTVINMRSRLAIQDHEDSHSCMHIVVDHKDEQYSFIVDNVGEVLNLSLNDFEQNPVNLPNNWQELALGVYRLESKLLVVLDIERLLKF